MHIGVMVDNPPANRYGQTTSLHLECYAKSLKDVRIIDLIEHSIELESNAKSVRGTLLECRIGSKEKSSHHKPLNLNSTTSKNIDLPIIGDFRFLDDCSLSRSIGQQDGHYYCSQYLENVKICLISQRH